MKDENYIFQQRWLKETILGGGLGVGQNGGRPPFFHEKWLIFGYIRFKSLNLAEINEKWPKTRTKWPPTGKNGENLQKITALLCSVARGATGRKF